MTSLFYQQNRSAPLIESDQGMYSVYREKRGQGKELVGTFSNAEVASSIAKLLEQNQESTWLGKKVRYFYQANGMTDDPMFCLLCAFAIGIVVGYLLR